VPRDSAIFGLPGDRENAIKLDAKHEDMCRFDLSNEKDKNNYFLVEGNLGDMCEAASKQCQSIVTSLGTLPHVSSAGESSDDAL